MVAAQDRGADRQPQMAIRLDVRSYAVQSAPTPVRPDELCDRTPPGPCVSSGGVSIGDQEPRKNRQHGDHQGLHFGSTSLGQPAGLPTAGLEQALLLATARAAIHASNSA